MNKKTGIKSAVITIISMAILLMATSGVNAQSTKESTMATAKEICEAAALDKYGSKSIKSIGPKVRWSKGLNGADVRMKIKKKARSPKPFSCIVALDGSATFYSM